MQNLLLSILCWVHTSREGDFPSFHHCTHLQLALRLHQSSSELLYENVPAGYVCFSLFLDKEEEEEEEEGRKSVSLFLTSDHLLSSTPPASAGLGSNVALPGADERKKR